MSDSLVLLITGSQDWHHSEVVRKVLQGIAPLYSELTVVHDGLCPAGEVASVEARKLGCEVRCLRDGWRETRPIVRFAEAMRKLTRCDVVCLSFGEGHYEAAHEAGIDTEIITEREATES